MSDSKTFPLFTPAATVADAIRASADQRPMQGAYITAITCTRDIGAIVDSLRRTRDGAREAAKDAKDAGDGYTSGVMTGMASGLNTAILKLEYWLNGSAPAPVEPDYSHEEARRDPSADTEDPSVRGY